MIALSRESYRGHPVRNLATVLTELLVSYVLMLAVRENNEVTEWKANSVEGHGVLISIQVDTTIRAPRTEEQTVQVLF